MKKRLSNAAINHGIFALKKIKIFCNSHGVEEILVHATRAIRETENGAESIALYIQTESDPKLEIGRESKNAIFLKR